MSTDTHETDRGVASTPRRRSWSGWRYGLLAAVALPCLVTMIVRLERARELRLLEQAGAVLKVGLNNHTIVAAEFADVEVSAEIARQLVGHRDLWRLSFHDCRIAAGVFPLLETLPDLQVLELVGATWESSAEFRRFLSARRLAMVEFSGTGLDDDDLAALDLTEISVMTIRDCDRLSEAAILSLPAAGQLRTLVLGGVALTRGICRDIKARRPDLELSVSPADLAEFKPLVDAGVELRLDEELNVIGLGIESDASLLPLDFLKQCHHLQRLKIAGADVSADLLRALCRCERLGFLSLEGSRIPGQELAGLARLVRLRSLNIDGVVVDGGSTLQLPRLPDLRALRANTAGMSDQALARLELPALEYICVGRPVTAAGLAELARFDTLIVIFLCDMSIDHDICQVLRSLGQIEHLGLYHCDIHEQEFSDVLLTGKIGMLHVVNADLPQGVIEGWNQLVPELAVMYWPY